jgi:hypothetical protein
MAAAAGMAYQQLFDVDIPYWPFEETASPFIDHPSHKKSVSADPDQRGHFLLGQDPGKRWLLQRVVPA